MNQIGLALCVTIAICVVGHIGASPLMKRNEAAEAQNCKDLCNLCNCVGFYCGDECICECNNKDDESEFLCERKKIHLFYYLNCCILFRFFLFFFCTDVKCVEDMQNNCEKSRIPYEVLIQGPTGSRFVRSLLSDDSMAQKATDPKKRSTISIFKPDEKEQSVPATEIEAADKSKTEEPAKDDAKVDVNVPEKDEQPAKSGNQDEAAKEDVKSNNEEKAKRDVDKAEAKEDAKISADETCIADKTPESVDAKKEKVPEDPKNADDAEQLKAEESADKQKDGEKKLKKRDADDELAESVVDPTDVAKNEGDSSKTNDGTTEPTVGLALPIVPPLIGLKPLVPGLIGLKVAPAIAALKAQIDIKKGKFFCVLLFFFLFIC